MLQVAPNMTMVLFSNVQIYSYLHLANVYQYRKIVSILAEYIFYLSWFLSDNNWAFFIAARAPPQQEQTFETTNDGSRILTDNILHLNRLVNRAAAR